MFKNFEAYFLGPRGDNADFYKELIMYVFNEHVKWRKEFHSIDDVEFVTKDDKNLEDFKLSQLKIKEVIEELMKKLKENRPFFSPRYIGHMNWEIMFLSIVSFFATSMFNPNNVAKAGGTGTSKLELEVGRDFAKLFGFNPDVAWGHIATGGTIANMEALWIARNMKVYPLILKEILNLKAYSNIDSEVQVRGIKVDLRSENEHNLLTMFNPQELIYIKEKIIGRIKLKNPEKKNEIDDLFDEKLSLKARGFKWNNKCVDVGVVVLPETKHYSFKKAMDLLGLGRESLRFVKVNDRYRMDMDSLKNTIKRVVEEEKRPILAVVGVVGSTEESSVDEIDKIFEIRKEFNSNYNIGFHVHIDAAYGGYVRTVFIDENGDFMELKKLKKILKDNKIIGSRDNIKWPSEEVYKAFKAMEQADTITVDPHKLGYVLYPAGGFVMRDKRMREAIQTFAPYVFKKPAPDEPDDLIGAYILEGSKPGAAAAAVWASHRALPLNITGYGRLIGETIDGAYALYKGLKNFKTVDLGNSIKIKAIPIVQPDINIVNYIFNFVGNKKLEKINELTAFIGSNILDASSVADIKSQKYFVSITDFTREEYSDAPYIFLKKLGVSYEDWQNIGQLTVLRSVVMSPYLTPDFVDKDYVRDFTTYIANGILSNRKNIEKVYRK